MDRDIDAGAGAQIDAAVLEAVAERKTLLMQRRRRPGLPPVAAKLRELAARLALPAGRVWPAAASEAQRQWRRRIVGEVPRAGAERQAGRDVAKGIAFAAHQPLQAAAHGERQDGQVGHQAGSRGRRRLALRSPLLYRSRKGLGKKER